MKKSVIIIIILAIIVVICTVGLKINSKIKQVAKAENIEYEEYLNKEIYGTDVISLINKAVNQNESNSVSKDSNGYYINNNINSIQIEIEFITDEEKEETQTYKMEQITNLGTDEFNKNFNSAKFKCTSKQYHSETGRISYIKITHVSE